jgi:HK97 family phage portal protein
MTTIQTADGRLLRATRPSGLTQQASGFSGYSVPGAFGPPDWQSSDEPSSRGNQLVSYERIYRAQPIVSGTVDKLTRRIASLPFDAYQVSPDRREREQTYGDSLATLLRRPMPGWGSTHLLAHISQSVFIHGSALTAKLRGPDRDAPPIMLWPLDWSQVSAYALPGGRIEWWSTTQFDGTERFLSTNDVILFAWPAPDGGEIGVSPLEKLGVTIRIEDAAQRFQEAEFRNGIRPSIAVSIPGNPKPEVMDVVRASIERMHKGVDHQRKTMLLAGDASVTPISMSPVEAALIEQRRLNKEEVGMVYDLAGPLMNDLTHGTYSNVEEMNRALYRDVLPPHLKLIEETFQAQLIDSEPSWLDRAVAFDLTDKLKGDPETLASTQKMRVEAGLTTRNEERRVLNMPPLDDPEADSATVNANNQAPLSSMNDSPNT